MLFIPLLAIKIIFAQNDIFPVAKFIVAKGSVNKIKVNTIAIQIAGNFFNCPREPEALFLKFIA